MVKLCCRTSAESYGRRTLALERFVKWAKEQLDNPIIMPWVLMSLDVSNLGTILEDYAFSH